MEVVKPNVESWNAAQLKDSGRRNSELCKTAHFKLDWYKKWCDAIRETPRLHRKQWEYVYILQALHERGCLREGKRGLGFAVGTEPLPSVMVGHGCTVMATDLDYERGESLGWDSGDQLCKGLNSLNERKIVPDEIFGQKADYRAVDMNAIPQDLTGYDFNWSSCSFEHLGSIKKGLKFLKAQLDTLKPGGWAVHTTEYNVSSEFDTTTEHPNTVIFRRSDLEEFADWAEQEGHYVEKLDFSLGTYPTDFSVDLPPYVSEPHVKLLLHGYVVTSIGLIIRKGDVGKKKTFWSRLTGT